MSRQVGHLSRVLLLIAAPGFLAASCGSSPPVSSTGEPQSHPCHSEPAPKDRSVPVESGDGLVGVFPLKRHADLDAIQGDSRPSLSWTSTADEVVRRYAVLRSLGDHAPPTNLETGVLVEYDFGAAGARVRLRNWGTPADPIWIVAHTAAIDPKRLQILKLDVSSDSVSLTLATEPGVSAVDVTGGDSDQTSSKRVESRGARIVQAKVDVPKPGPLQCGSTVLIRSTPDSGAPSLLEFVGAGAYPEPPSKGPGDTGSRTVSPGYPSSE